MCLLALIICLWKQFFINSFIKITKNQQLQYPISAVFEIVSDFSAFHHRNSMALIYKSLCRESEVLCIWMQMEGVVRELWCHGHRVSEHVNEYSGVPNLRLSIQWTIKQYPQSLFHLAFQSGECLLLLTARWQGYRLKWMKQQLTEGNTSSLSFPPKGTATTSVPLNFSKNGSTSSVFKICSGSLSLQKIVR